jgi:CRP-like cAMP-binding protein
MPEMALVKDTTWRVLRPARIVLLDEQFSVRAAGSPAVTRAMVSQAARTTHWLFAKALIVSCPLVEERLMLLFALLGERWGKVTPAGVVLSLPLTHRTLAHLCGARRPSVTVSLRTLRAEGVVERTPDNGWLLRRPEPETTDCRSTCWARYAETLGLQ